MHRVTSLKSRSDTTKRNSSSQLLPLSTAPGAFCAFCLRRRCGRPAWPSPLCAESPGAAGPLRGRRRRRCGDGGELCRPGKTDAGGGGRRMRRKSSGRSTVFFFQVHQCSYLKSMLLQERYLVGQLGVVKCEERGTSAERWFKRPPALWKPLLTSTAIQEIKDGVPNLEEFLTLRQ